MLRRKSLFSGISEQKVRFLMGSTEDFKNIVTVTLVAASDNTFGVILQLELFEILHTGTFRNKNYSQFITLGYSCASLFIKSSDGTSAFRVSNSLPSASYFAEQIL